MHTKKGYIVPVILVVLLLTAGGVVLFGQKLVESPIVETELIVPTKPSIEIKEPLIEQEPEPIEQEQEPIEQEPIVEVEDLIEATTTSEIEIE